VAARTVSVSYFPRRCFRLLMKDLLLKRFDRTFVNHILQVWTRVVKGFDALMKTNGGKIQWHCKTIQVPFTSLLDTSLSSLLSEGTMLTRRMGVTSYSSSSKILCSDTMMLLVQCRTCAMKDKTNQVHPFMRVFSRQLVAGCVPTLNGCFQLK
jgi:hypothetical protein